MVEETELREPYVSTRQQRDADVLGLWIFLATEAMIFGGLFATMLVMRVQHPEDYVEASKRLHVFIGGLNTLVLLTSSFAVALAVQAGENGKSRRCTLSLALAAFLGLAFLGIKAFEYSKEYGEGLLPVAGSGAAFSGPVEHLFMNVYLVATGLHAVHVSVGIALLSGLAFRIGREWLPLPRRAVVIETVGLYWHLVDIVWVFLYPVLYLAR